MTRNKSKFERNEQQIIKLSMASGQLFVAESALRSLRNQEPIESVATTEELAQLESTIALLSRLSSDALNEAQLLTKQQVESGITVSTLLKFLNFRFDSNNWTAEFDDLQNVFKGIVEFSDDSTAMSHLPSDMVVPITLLDMEIDWESSDSERAQKYAKLHDLFRDWNGGAFDVLPRRAKPGLPVSQRHDREGRKSSP